MPGPLFPGGAMSDQKNTRGVECVCGNCQHEGRAGPPVQGNPTAIPTRGRVAHAHDQADPGPTRKEEAIEAQLDTALLLLQSTRSPKIRRKAFEEMQRLHKQRSATQVDRMERARKLK